MYALRGILATFLIALVAVSALDARKSVTPVKGNCQGTCNVQVRCNPYGGEPVFVLDKGVCKVYKNSCMLMSENCNRENSCLPKLETTEKELCVPYCPGICTRIFRPVCAKFTSYTASGDLNSEEQFFSNQCVANSWACKNGKPYTSIVGGYCGEAEKQTLDVQS